MLDEPVHLETYNPEWERAFQSEQTRLGDVLRLRSERLGITTSRAKWLASIGSCTFAAQPRAGAVGADETLAAAQRERSPDKIRCSTNLFILKRTIRSGSEHFNRNKHVWEMFFDCDLNGSG